MNKITLLFKRLTRFVCCVTPESIDRGNNPPLRILHHEIEGRKVLAWDNDDCWDIIDNSGTYYWHLKPANMSNDSQLP